MLCALSFAGLVAHGQKLVGAATPPLPFEPTEELLYEGEFSRLLLRGINIAEFRFVASAPRAEPTTEITNQSNVTSDLHFTLEVVSKGLFTKLFGLRFHQRIESRVERSSFAVRQTNKLDQQGDRVRTSEAIFDRNAGKVVWTEVDPKNPARPPRVITSEINGAVQDIASAFYFLRTQPLVPGSAFEIALSDSGRIYRVPVCVLEKKRMKTVLGHVLTVRVAPELFGEGRLLAGKGQVSIWLIDDARRVPVRTRITSDMGTLDIKLKRIVPARHK